MNDYSIALFLHIAGTLGFFVTLGLEWTGLAEMQNATLPGQARAWMGILKSKTVNGLGSASMLTILLTGFYMVIRVWGAIPWVIATLGALVLAIVLFVAVSRPRMAALGQALAAEQGPVVSQTLLGLANDPLLWLSMWARLAVALAIIFLKVAKPDFTGSLLTIGVAIVLGIATALPVLRAERPHERLAH